MWYSIPNLMPRQKLRNPVDYIVPLNINGLDGRMMHVPASNKKNKREILLIYGHHAMIERWWGLVENLYSYGNVTMPDLPGFGGMDSFYKIGRKPDVDSFADYLAAFIKLRYKRKRLTIIGISYGFVVVTRMLQKYPELAGRVDVLVSLVGFMHKDDFVYTPRQRKLFSRVTRVFATRPVALFIRYAGLNKFVLTTLYSKLPNSKRRMIEITEEEFMTTMDFEVRLWQANDVRTHWQTTSEFLEVDNCQTKVDLPIHHVISEQDHYFNNQVVEQHMQIVFNDYHKYVARSKAHTPSVLGDKKAMSVMLPPGLRKVLGKK
jgi:pimeloyl-ACP methyl ester carboxylesterase